MMYAGSLSITNPTSRDWPKLQSFLRYAYQMKGEVWQGGSPIVKNNLGRPHYSLEKDLFMAELNRRVVGIADVTIELRIARAIIEWFVHPAVHRKNIGRALIKYVYERARQKGARVVHVCIPEEDSFNRNFIFQLGFSQARCYLAMVLDLKGSVDRFPPDVRMEHFRAGDDALLATVQNRIFTGSWGFCPNSPDDIRYFFRLTRSKWQDILMFRENAKIIGYSWLHHAIKEGKPIAKRKWLLHMFGVDPEFQGKGWGKKLFQTSLAYVRRREGTSLELTVDSENTPAVHLYKSGGFRVKSREFWYQKEAFPNP